MQSNFPNIFAAGDVAESKNRVTGQTDVVPGWGKACTQGKVAGLNMMGRQERYVDSTRENISTLFGLTVASIRLAEISNSDKREELEFFDPRAKVYRKILSAGNRIVGAILLGKTEDAGIIRNLINSKVDISLWKEEIGKTLLNLRGLLFNPLLRFRRLF
jgi:NAD(P)H-nitrite reductase large subunit